MQNKLPKGLVRKEQIPAGTKIIDKGTVVIKDEKSDLARLLKYIETLAAGDETYRPAGLEFRKNSDVNKLNKTATSMNFMPDNRNNIRFVN